MALGTGQSWCLFLLIPLTNVLLIASCSNLLVAAKDLRDIPTKHGDQWVDKLITWSIVGICVGVIETIFLIVWFWFVRNLSDESTAFRNSLILFSVVQAILVSLTLVALIVPGIDMWPDSYQETDWVMYSAIWFIVIYFVWLVIAARAVCKRNVNSNVTNAA